MRSSGLVDGDERRDRPDRPSHLDRVRPGESLVLFPLMAAAAWSFVIAVFATVSQLLGPEDGTWGDVAGAALGNFVMVFALTFVISAIIRVSGHRGSTTPEHADWGPPTPPLSAEQLRRSHAHESRRVARGATLGAAPGWVLAVAPLLLHDLGVISGDQSQIGFIGLPILIVGTVVGAATAAADSGSTGAALLGCGTGFAVGVIAGVLVAAATSLAGVWLVTTPLGMIAGAALSTYLRLRHNEARAPR